MRDRASWVRVGVGLERGVETSVFVSKQTSSYIKIRFIRKKIETLFRDQNFHVPVFIKLNRVIQET